MVNAKAASRARARRSLAAARSGRRFPAAARRSGLVVAAAALVAALLLGLAQAHRANPVAPAGPEGVPVPVGPPLAVPDTIAGGRTVDDIACQSSEQVAYHYHAHLAVFVEGRARQIPAGIGIAAPRHVQTTPTGVFVNGGSCFYWLHTHAADGVIHVEAPSQQIYTLGEFFDIWRQPLSATQVGPLRGTVTVFLDGHRRRIDPRTIALTAHRVIQLDVGTPIAAPRPIAFPPGL